MPRKPRIEINGYYHIVNRGVERRVVFEENDDYEYFIELLCVHSKNYTITVHSYCLMCNHYHLLISIEKENLSKFMRQLNSDYAVYFNKKYKRTGHLWQGRFKSWYVTDEAYLYTLTLYIEQNPLKAHIVKNVEEYPYSSAHIFLGLNSLPLSPPLDALIKECLENSWVTQSYQGDTEAIKAFLESSVDTGQLQELKNASSLLAAANSNKKPDIKKLAEILAKATDMTSRNKLIVTSYEKGYSQHMMAKVLGVSQAAIYGVIKRSKK